MATIAPTTYLRNWALVASIITTRFMVDQHPSLFQQHFKVACDLIPPLARTCFLLFEQLIEQQIVQLQNSIPKCLHHHTLSNMLSDAIYETHHAQILSCYSPKVGAWLIIRPVFPSFRLASLVFSIALWIQLGLPHPLIASILWCMCKHPINSMGIHLLCCAHGNKHTIIHDAICNTFTTIVWDVDLHVGWKQVHVFPSNTFNSSRWQVDIVLTKDGICTLVDVVIANPTQADLLLWFCATQGFVASNATQAK
jgi:hypothetical protein